MLEIENLSPICFIDEDKESWTADGVKALFADNSVDVEICANGYVAIVQPKTEIIGFKISVNHKLTFEAGGAAFNAGGSGVVSIPRSAIPGAVYHSYMP